MGEALGAAVFDFLSGGGISRSSSGSRKSSSLLLSASKSLSSDSISPSQPCREWEDRVLFEEEAIGCADVLALRDLEEALGEGVGVLRFLPAAGGEG